jgi:hypothetical protein
MGPSLRMLLLINFALSMVLISNFLPCMCLNRMELWNERTTLQLRWQGQCSMSIRLIDAFGLMLSALHVISPIKISYTRSWIWPPLCFALDASHPSLISDLLVISALSWSMTIWANLSLISLMAFWIKILYENLAYVRNQTQRVPLVARSWPHSYWRVIGPRNWVRYLKSKWKHKTVQANPWPANPPTSHDNRLVVDWIKNQGIAPHYNSCPLMHISLNTPCAQDWARAELHRVEWWANQSYQGQRT